MTSAYMRIAVGVSAVLVLLAFVAGTLWTPGVVVWFALALLPPTMLLVGLHSSARLVLLGRLREAPAVPRSITRGHRAASRSWPMTETRR